jgi:hypothetical protein
MVEYSTYNPKIKGSNPATVTGGRENGAKTTSFHKRFFLLEQAPLNSKGHNHKFLLTALFSEMMIGPIRHNFLSALAISLLT